MCLLVTCCEKSVDVNHFLLSISPHSCHGLTNQYRNLLEHLNSSKQHFIEIMTAKQNYGDTLCLVFTDTWWSALKVQLRKLSICDRCVVLLKISRKTAQPE